MTDTGGIRLALEEARAAAEQGEVPVGAVIVVEDRVVARGANRTITDCDPTAHAEIVALRAAAQALGNYRLMGATLYVTVEPCVMCAGAMIQARVARLVYGCDEPKGGAARSCFALFEHPSLNHRVAVTAGVLGAECAAVLQSFLASRIYTIATWVGLSFVLLQRDLVDEDVRHTPNKVFRTGIRTRWANRTLPHQSSHFGAAQIVIHSLSRGP